MSERFGTHFLRGVSLIAIQLAIVPPAMATGDYAQAAAHTDRMIGYAEEAQQRLRAAKARVSELRKLNIAAKAAYDLARSNPAAARAAAAAALDAASRALAVAEGAVTVATAGLELAAAGVVGVTVGTGMHQLGAGAWDLCFDPLCDLSHVQPGATFTPATEEEVEAALPALMVKYDGVEYAESSFVGPARVAWDYMVLGGRFYLDTARGAASYNSGDYAGLFEASASMETEIQAIPLLMAQAADVLDNQSVFPETTYVEGACPTVTLTALQDGVAALDWVLTVLQMGSETSDPCHLDQGGPGCDSTALVVSATDMRDALQAVYDEIVGRALIDGNGLPRKWVDFAGKGTRADFQAFIAGVQATGVAGLPQWEVYAGDTLLSIAGVQIPSAGSIGPAMAAYDSAANGEEEDAIYTGQDSVTLSRVLRVSATTLSPNGRWLGYRMDESPVWVGVGDGEQTPSRTQILAIHPNPTRAGAAVRFAVSVATPCRLELGLFDVAGRKVTEVVTPASVGTRILSVAESDARRLGSGVYLVRLLADGLVVDRGKVVLLAP